MKIIIIKKETHKKESNHEGGSSDVQLCPSCGTACALLLDEISLMLVEAPERPVIQPSRTQPDKSTEPTSCITRQLFVSKGKQWAHRVYKTLSSTHKQIALF